MGNGEVTWWSINRYRERDNKHHGFCVLMSYGDGLYATVTNINASPITEAALDF